MSESEYSVEYDKEHDVFIFYYRRAFSRVWRWVNLTSEDVKNCGLEDRILYSPKGDITAEEVIEKIIKFSV